MSRTKIEVDPQALVATIEVLWGPQMIAVADRVYSVLDRLAGNSYEAGMIKGEQAGQKNAMAPSAVGEPNATTIAALQELENGGGTPMTPEDLYRDAMIHNAQASTRLGQEELEGFGVPVTTACGHDSALCVNFPGCGCA